MKTISILIPTYNEEENVRPLKEAICSEFASSLPTYRYEIVFIDNCSSDHTRNILREICEEDKHCKAIFNAKNFGQFNSPYYGLQQTNGACTILMCADFQDPIDMIPCFVRAWEEGYQLVIGQKTSSKESPVLYFLRTIYYKLIQRFSEVEQIAHFTGFGLYDRSFLEVLKNLKDPIPFLRGIVAEFGAHTKTIPYVQAKRRAGKSSNNFFKLYDAAMLSFTSYTKIGLRIATFFGFSLALISLAIALVYLVLKLLYWDRFIAGTAPLVIGLFMLGAIQLIFIGLLGEYILSINQRIMNRPLVIEEERINFGQDDA